MGTIHTSHPGTDGGGLKTKGGTVLGAPPLGRSNRKIAIHPLSFGRNQSVCQSSSPERAEAWVDKAVQSW